MELLSTYIPIDRRLALAQKEALPERTHGTALFADISGFTPLTEALVAELGPRRGSDELTRQLNQVYDALIAEVQLTVAVSLLSAGMPLLAGLMLITASGLRPAARPFKALWSPLPGHTPQGQRFPWP